MMSPSHALLHSLVSAWSLWYTVQWFPYLGSCCLSVQGGRPITIISLMLYCSISFIPFSFLSPFPICRSHPPFPLPSLAISRLSSPPHLPHFCFSSPSLSLSLIFSSPSSTHLGSIQKYKPYLYRFAIGVKDEHSWFRGCDIARRLPFVLIAFFVVLGRPSIILVSIVYLVCK